MNIETILEHLDRKCRIALLTQTKVDISTAFNMDSLDWKENLHPRDYHGRFATTNTPAKPFLERLRVAAEKTGADGKAEIATILDEMPKGSTIKVMGKQLLKTETGFDLDGANKSTEFVASVIRGLSASTKTADIFIDVPDTDSEEEQGIQDGMEQKEKECGCDGQQIVVNINIGGGTK